MFLLGLRTLLRKGCMVYIFEALSRDHLLRFAKEDNFLDVVDRAKEVKNIKLVRAGKNKQTLYFRIRSVTDPKKYYAAVVKTQERQVRPEQGRFPFRGKAIDGSLWLFCSCPAYKFWGHKYFLSIADTNWGPKETRYPIIRNSQLLGEGLCKHLYALLERLPKLVKSGGKNG